MEHSERGAYVTDQVATWIINDGDWYGRAQYYAQDANPERLERYLAQVLADAPEYSAPWQVAQELSANDYDRVDWKGVARLLLDE